MRTLADLRPTIIPGGYLGPAWQLVPDFVNARAASEGDKDRQSYSTYLRPVFDWEAVEGVITFVTIPKVRTKALDTAELFNQATLQNWLGAVQEDVLDGWYNVKVDFLSPKCIGWNWLFETFDGIQRQILGPAIYLIGKVPGHRGEAQKDWLFSQRILLENEADAVMAALVSGSHDK